MSPVETVDDLKTLRKDELTLAISDSVIIRNNLMFKLFGLVGERGLTLVSSRCW